MFASGIAVLQVRFSVYVAPHIAVFRLALGQSTAAKTINYCTFLCYNIHRLYKYYGQIRKSLSTPDATAFTATAGSVNS